MRAERRTKIRQEIVAKCVANGKLVNGTTLTNILADLSDESLKNEFLLETIAIRDNTIAALLARVKFFTNGFYDKIRHARGIKAGEQCVSCKGLGSLYYADKFAVADEKIDTCQTCNGVGRKSKA